MGGENMKNKTNYESYESSMAARVKRAEAIQAAGISLALADLGVIRMETKDPNTEYIPTSSEAPFDAVYTDGQVDYAIKNGTLVGTVTNATWAAVTSGKHVVLYTEKDKTAAASSIRGWLRSWGYEKTLFGREYKMKRLAWPVFI